MHAVAAGGAAGVAPPPACVFTSHYPQPVPPPPGYGYDRPPGYDPPAEQPSGQRYWRQAEETAPSSRAICARMGVSITGQTSGRACRRWWCTWAEALWRSTRGWRRRDRRQQRRWRQRRGAGSCCIPPPHSQAMRYHQISPLAVRLGVCVPGCPEALYGSDLYRARLRGLGTWGP